MAAPGTARTAYPGADARAGPGWSRLWPLVPVAVVVTVLGAVGVLPRWSGLAHLVALPPLDLFTDLRLLLTEATSLPAFLALLVVVLAVRVLVLATLLGGLTADRLRFATLFYLVWFPVLLLAATVDFASYAVLYSRTFWIVVLAVALLVLVAAPAPWQRPESWRLRSGLARSFRHGLRVEVMVPYAVVLVGIGALAELGGGAVAVAVVPVSALATAVAIRFLARPVTGRPSAASGRSAAEPAVKRPESGGTWRRLAAVGAGLALLGTGFVATRGVEFPPPSAPRDGSLLLMSGINSASGDGSIFETDVERLGYTCDQVYYYSYAGPGDGAPLGEATCPIRTGEPYRPADTQQPMAGQVEFFADQVRDLPRPLVVAGHSLGAWVAWEAVATGRAPEVDVLVLVGPFPDNPVGYPAANQTGPSKVAGDLLRLLAPAAATADFYFEPDAPSAREMLATPNAARAVFAQPLPDGVRGLSITTAADLPLMTGGWRLPVERNACPVREAHPLLPETPALYQEVNRFLDREPPLSCPAWRDWGAPLARPFGVPPAAV